MNISALLFDKDGTLIDFDQTWLPAYQQATQLLAMQSPLAINSEELLQIGGYNAATQSWQADSLLAAGSNAQILRHWEEASGLKIEGDLLIQLQQIFSSSALSFKSTVTDLPAYIDALKRQNFKLGIATMDDCEHAKQALTALNVDDKFDFICGADSGYGEKPEPGMLHAFATHCQVPTNRIAMIGDSPRDLLMARNAGAACAIGVLTGASDKSDLEPFADYILESIVALPALLQEMGLHR